jgi:hypothetical protein
MYMSDCFDKFVKFAPVLWIRPVFQADPDPAFYLDPDPDFFYLDPDLGRQSNADQDPGQTLKSQNDDILHEKCTLSSVLPASGSEKDWKRASSYIRKENIEQKGIERIKREFQDPFPRGGVRFTRTPPTHKRRKPTGQDHRSLPLPLPPPPVFEAKNGLDGTPKRPRPRG